MRPELTLLRAERSRVRDDEAPPRLKQRGEIARLVQGMQRGSWVQESHARAKSFARVIRQFGGRSIVYRTSELFSVCKVLEAPWMNGLDSKRPALERTK